MKTPLWVHAIKCIATVAIALWGSMLISQLFHKKADELVHKEVIFCSFSPSEKQSRAFDSSLFLSQSMQAWYKR